MPSTAGVASSSLSDGSSSDGGGVSCDLSRDDDGATYLWAHDHDGNSSTPLVCGGADNQLEDSYAPYAYDATYAIAHALHALIEVGHHGQMAILARPLLASISSSGGCI